MGSLQRLGRIVSGAGLILLGVVFLFIPGPGLSTIVAGLIHLSGFAWARWVLRRLAAGLVRFVIYLKQTIQDAEHTNAPLIIRRVRRQVEPGRRRRIPRGRGAKEIQATDDPSLDPRPINFGRSV